SRWLARGGEPLLAVWLDPHVSNLELRRGSRFASQESQRERRRHNFDPMEVFSKRPGIGVGGVTHATFLRVGCGVHKAAGWAANSCSSHTMSDLPADSSPPCQQSRAATRLCSNTILTPKPPSDSGVDSVVGRTFPSN